MSAIARASASRRANCAEFLEEFAEGYAVEGDDLEASWRDIVATYPWYAEDVIHCMKQVHQTRAELPELICELAVQSLDVEPEEALSRSRRQELGHGWVDHWLAVFDPIFEEASR